MTDETDGQAADNTVYVGSKPVLSYALAVVTQLEQGHDEVNIKARGGAISRAVDVAELVRHKFAEDTQVRETEIGTDSIADDAGDDLNVSSIHIRLGPGA